jgi:diguanylate cyclase (GGDEF)-like protein
MKLQESPSDFKATHVRRVRVGLRTKLFLSFLIAFSAYAVGSATYLLQHFFEDKSRYVMFSLHQSAEASCVRLGALTPQSPSTSTSDLLAQLETGSSFVFDATTGQVVAQHVVGTRESSAPSSAELWSQIRSRGQGDLGSFTSKIEVEGRSLFLSACQYRAGTATQWLLIAVDADEALRPAFGLLVKMGGLFGLILLAGLVLVYVVARRLTRPLEVLAAMADELGAGNYHHKVSVPGHDELGVLADSFANLSQRLNARETELEKSTDLANRDFLTGLWNRRYLERRLGEHFSLSRRHGNDLSLIYLDADHFKRINDTYGHASGDEVLQGLAEIMKSQLRKTDFLARVGGEEFVMVCPETNLEGALQVATKLRAKLAEHDFLGPQKIKMTASFGVASLSELAPGEDAVVLMQRADAMAYKSKNSGRDRITSSRG